MRNTVIYPRAEASMEISQIKITYFRCTLIRKRIYHHWYCCPTISEMWWSSLIESPIKLAINSMFFDVIGLAMGKKPEKKEDKKRNFKLCQISLW